MTVPANDIAARQVVVVVCSVHHLVPLDVLMVVEVVHDEVRQSHGGSVLQRLEVGQALGLDELKVLEGVLVLDIGFGVEVQLVILAKELVEVVEWQLVVQFLV